MKLAAENEYNLLKIEKKKITFHKHILALRALPTKGQKCIFAELYPFELANLELGHPV